MKITKRAFKEDNQTEALKSLNVKEECIEIDLEKLESTRQLIRRVTKKTGFKFSTRSFPEEGIARVWRIE